MKKYSEINLNDAPDPAFVIAYYSEGIEIGYRKETKISYFESCSFPESDLMELHIFDDKTEFRAVKVSEENPQWKVIIINDEIILEELRQSEPKIDGKDEIYDLESDHVLDEYMSFYGETWIAGEEGNTILEDQKRRKKVYLTITPTQVKQGLTLGVRNYLTYDSEDRVVVYNYRLTGIFSGRQKEEGYSNHSSIQSIRTGRGELLEFR